MKTFTAPTYSMLSGRDIAEAAVYRRIDGKSGQVWLIAKQPNEADGVYVHNPKAKNSDGFGGATLEFKLEDGSIYRAKGPWKTGPDGLFVDTGYDIREKHATVVVIGRARSYDYSRDKYYGQCVIGDVLYEETEPVIGKFDRVKDIAATLGPGKYAYWMETHGMTSNGFVEISDPPSPEQAA